MGDARFMGAPFMKSVILCFRGLGKVLFIFLLGRIGEIFVPFLERLM